MQNLITYPFCYTISARKLEDNIVDFLKCYINPSITETSGLPARHSQCMLMRSSFIINANHNQRHTRSFIPRGERCRTNSVLGPQKCQELFCLNCWYLPLEFIENYFLKLNSGFTFNGSINGFTAVSEEIRGRPSGSMLLFCVIFLLGKLPRKKEKPILGKVFRNYSRY